ncbi:hypothetical protein FPOA_12102 [Fusarium poae]|uniref:PD-(D/E)XK nuclease-like domain-containing protein n=1 Tax=Fusarium poae TaxID=36050 RepID=A0A1B8AAG2_FUSPO|nr:hypothetical protein FPOA_12102 [Fusarium poae]
MESDLKTEIERWLEVVYQSSENSLEAHAKDDRPDAKRQQEDDSSDSDTSDAQQPAKKQKLHDQLPSPENSFSRLDLMAPQTPTVKRKGITDNNDDDDDPTPRASKSNPPLTASNSRKQQSNKSPSKKYKKSGSRSHTESETSADSSRSAAVKLFPIYGIGSHALLSEVMKLDAAGMPEELADMYLDLYQISNNQNFLPRHWKAAIKARALKDPHFKVLGDFSYLPLNDSLEHPSPESERLFLSLLDSIDHIAAETARCCNSFDELAWNNLVHTPILAAVFNQRLWPGDAMLKCSPLMTAPVTATQHMFEHSSAKVDYVVHIQPPVKTHASIRKLYDSTSEKSVNHTAFHPMRQSPICLSIETKRYSGDSERAHAQVCSWQAAQWTYLASHAGGGIKHLPFLPGIVVNGQSWTFVATTREGEVTTIWTEGPLGSTMSSLGVLKVMGALNRLRQWIIDVYWPWYEKYVLKIGLVELEVPTQAQAQVQPQLQSQAPSELRAQVEGEAEGDVEMDSETARSEVFGLSCQLFGDDPGI